MKSLKFLFISLVLLAVANDVYACWESWYTPKGYYMYRVDSNGQGPSSDVDPLSETDRNCLEWQKLTSDSIPLKDIYQVVYKMELQQLESIYDNRGVKYDNEFVEWITKRDSTLLDFLLLAKTNEYIRLKRNSRWYYPSMKIGARMTLDEIAEKAISQKDIRLRTRYLLQGVRALFSLSKYEECIELWENEISHLPEDNLMRQLIHPYIAGAEYRLNRKEKALEYFAQIGDVESMLFCVNHSGKELSIIDVLEFVCEYAPNSKYIEGTLQSYIRNLEPMGSYYEDEYKFEPTPDFEKLQKLCMKMARGGKSNKPAMWYYTAAFLEDLNGDTTKASQLLGLAENSKSTEYIDGSIKTFRMYLDAKMLPYDSNYENRLFSQLRWLDSAIEANIDDNVRDETARGYKIFTCESYYYWNDVMRRIVLAEVCPRMIKSGKTIRALQLANMADNRLLNLVDKREIYDWMYEDKVVQSHTMSSYRYSTNFNIYDYSNHFFEMIDSVGVDVAIKYVRRVNKPLSDFDRFLNSRGYVGSDYLNDIIGTQCLRKMRYQEALKYLGKVSDAYKNHINVCMTHDPFSATRKSIKTKSDFKYDFAREMYSLEQGIELTSEPNRKAMLMVKYAIGIRNSFDLCWELTQYYRGSVYCGQVCEKPDWENDDNTKGAIAKVKDLIDGACNIVTDDEIGANIQYMLCNFKTVARDYPNTEKARLVRGRCDNLYDHHAELRQS